MPHSEGDGLEVLIDLLVQSRSGTLMILMIQRTVFLSPNATPTQTILMPFTPEDAMVYNCKQNKDWPSGSSTVPSPILSPLSARL